MNIETTTIIEIHRIENNIDNDLMIVKNENTYNRYYIISKDATPKAIFWRLKETKLLSNTIMFIMFNGDIVSHNYFDNNRYYDM